MMQPLIDKYTHTALMGDMVELPPETHKVIKLKKPDYEVNEEWEPMAQFVADHRLEQLQKGKEIKKIAKGYRKVVVVAHYREQIDQLNAQLSKERQTFVIDGRTRDTQAVVREAEESPECYLIIQASVGAGFELPSFAVMIFASQGYSVRNYIQMIGRIKRINALKPTYYYYLQAGRCDQMIYKSIKKGEDFVPSSYKRHEVT
jgi:predicted helicase